MRRFPDVAPIRALLDVAPGRALLASTVALLAACHSTPKLPDPGHGPGLVSFDRDPPAGAEIFARPEWKEGDRLAYRKARLRKLSFRVAKDEGDGWKLVDEESGSALHLDADFRELGETRPGEKKAGEDAGKDSGMSFTQDKNAILLDPGDTRYCWPLWVGKHWTCEFVHRGPNEPAFPLIANYWCDAIETVKTPAGTFRALRIWRAARVAAKGDFVERVALTWYAPDAGTMVKSLDDGILTELDELQRQ
jgi:hypothetical protein